MADGVEQMGLPEAGGAIDEEGVVGAGGRLGDRQGGGVGETVRGADHELVEGVPGIETPGRPEAGGLLVGRGRGREVARGRRRGRRDRRECLFGSGVGLHRELHPELLARDVPQGVCEHAGVAGADAVGGERARNCEGQDIVGQADRAYALEPQSPRVRCELGAEGCRAVLPDLGGGDTPVKFHRCIHRCGERSSWGHRRWP